MKTFLLMAGAALMFTGCNGTDKCDSGSCETGTGNDTTDTTDTSDTGVADSAVASWDAAGTLTLTITGLAGTTYDFGMAETGAGATGWYGEDCILDPDNDAAGDFSDYGYEICHQASASGLTLTHTGDADTVVASSTTLLPGTAGANVITYVLFETGADTCWTWGNDVTWYDGFGCTELM